MPHDDQPQRRFRPPAPGEVIRRGRNFYRIGAAIGGGAFGGVWECTDEWDNELAAKVFAPLGPYEQIRDKWLDEAKKLLALRHPNITFVYDGFEYENTFYLIMERCHGTLDDIIHAPGLAREAWLMPVARSVLQAVNFMHEHGYVHKDLHARNVLTSLVKDELTGRTTPARVFKVADLGVSQLESDIDSFHTALAQWMLPPEYLNPREFGYIGKTTDIYHVGLMLLSLLLGRNAVFSAEEIQAGQPRLAAQSLASPFAGPLARALRRHAAFRTQSAIDFWYDLKTAAAAQAPLAIPLPDSPSDFQA